MEKKNEVTNREKSRNFNVYYFTGGFSFNAAAPNFSFGGNSSNKSGVISFTANSQQVSPFVFNCNNISLLN